MHQTLYNFIRGKASASLPALPMPAGMSVVQTVPHTRYAMQEHSPV